MDPAEIRVTVNWPQPVDGKAMQHFLGAANFHHDYAFTFAAVAAFFDSCSNDTIIDWTPECLEAFTKLKQLFADNVELNHVCWDEPIFLTTDACQTGIGAWVGQKDASDIILPFICASKKLFKTQQCWSTNKWEVYALM